MAEEIDIHARLHDAVSGPADRAARSLDEVADEARDADRALGGLDRQSGQTARGLDRVAAAALRARMATAGAVDEAEDLQVNLGKLQVAMRNAGASNDKLGASLNRTAVLKARLGREGNKLERTLFRITTATRRTVREGGMLSNVFGRLQKDIQKTTKIADLLPRIFSAIKIPLVITGVTLLSTAVSALGAAAFAAVAGLSPLVGVLGAIPALVGGLGFTVGVFKLGMKGVGDAVKVLGDESLSAAEKAEKLKGVAPEIQAFATELVAANKQLDHTRRAIGQRLLPGLTDGLKSVMTLLPVFEHGMNQAAEVIGDVARRGGAVVATWGDDLRGIMDRNARITESMGNTAISGLTIFKNLMIAGGPLAERFAHWVERIAWNLNQAVDAATRSGRLERFFERAGDLAADVGKVLGDIAIGLFNIGKLSSDLGGAMGKDIQGLARDFREWTESAEGQRKIRQFFKDAIPVVREIGRLIRDLVVGFGSLADNDEFLETLVKLRTEALPAAMALANGMTENLGPALADLITAFLEFSNILSFDPLVTAARIFGELATAITGMIELTPGLSYFLATLVTLRLSLFLLGAAMRLTGITWLLRNIPKLVRAFNILKGASIALWAVMAANPITATIVVIGLLIGALVLLYRESETARDIMNAVFRAIGGAALDAVDFILAGFEKLFGVLGKLPGKFGEPFRKAEESVKKARAVVDGMQVALDNLGREEHKVTVGVQVNGLTALERMNTIMQASGATSTGYTGSREMRVEATAPRSFSGSTRVSSGGRGGAFSGGMFGTGAQVLTGELGPELVLFRGGGQAVVGADSPELVRFTRPGYVVPAAGTPESITKPIPDWVYGRLSTERPIAQVPSWVEARVPVPAAATTADSGPSPYEPLPAPNITIYPQTPMDVVAIVEKAYEDLERRRRERK